MQRREENTMYSANDNIPVNETRLSEDQKRSIATVIVGIAIICIKAKASNDTLGEEDYNALKAMGQICATFMTQEEAQKFYAEMSKKTIVDETEGT
jgi:hypothetical protein